MTLVGCEPWQQRVGLEGSEGADAGTAPALPIVCSPGAVEICQASVGGVFVRPARGRDRAIGMSWGPGAQLFVAGEGDEPEPPGQRSQAFVAGLSADFSLKFYQQTTWRNQEWNDRAVAVLPNGEGTLTLVGHHAVNGHVYHPWADRVDAATGALLAARDFFTRPCVETPADTCVEGLGQKVFAAQPLASGALMFAGDFARSPLGQVTPTMTGAYAADGVTGLLVQVKRDLEGLGSEWGRVLGGLSVETIFDLAIVDDGGKEMVFAVGRGPYQYGARTTRALHLLGVDPLTGEPTILATLPGSRDVLGARIATSEKGGVFVLAALAGTPDAAAQFPALERQGEDVPSLALIRFSPQTGSNAYAPSWARTVGLPRTTEVFAIARQPGGVLVAADLRARSAWAALVPAEAATVVTAFTEEGAARYTAVVNVGAPVEVHALATHPQGGFVLAGGYSGAFGLSGRAFGPVPSGEQDVERWDLFLLRVLLP